MAGSKYDHRVHICGLQYAGHQDGGFNTDTGLTGKDRIRHQHPLGSIQGISAHIVPYPHGADGALDSGHLDHGYIGLLALAIAIAVLVTGKNSVGAAEGVFQPGNSVAAHGKNTVRFRSHPCQYVIVLDNSEFVAVRAVIVNAVQL